MLAITLAKPGKLSVVTDLEKLKNNYVNHNKCKEQS